MQRHVNRNDQSTKATPARFIAFVVVISACLVSSSFARAQTLHTQGSDVWVRALFGSAADSAEGPGFLSVSLVSPSSLDGEAFSSAQYNGALGVEANSAPDGTGAVEGDRMSARSLMATLNRIDAMPGGPSAGTLIDIRLDYNLDGRMTSFGNSLDSVGRLGYGLSVGRETTNTTLLSGHLTFSDNSVIFSSFGLPSPMTRVDFSTDTPFIDIAFSDSRTFQVEVGELFSVQAILSASTQRSMRASFLDTAGFSLVALTPGVQVSIIPVPEPSTGLLFALGLATLSSTRRWKDRSLAESKS